MQMKDVVFEVSEETRGTVFSERVIRSDIE